MATKRELVLLPSTCLLAIARDDVCLVSVDVIHGQAAANIVLNSGNVARLDDVITCPAVEAIHRGVAVVADQLIPSGPVDEVSTQAVCDLVRAPGPLRLSWGPLSGRRLWCR